MKILLILNVYMFFHDNLKEFILKSYNSKANDNKLYNTGAGRNGVTNRLEFIYYINSD